MGWLRDSMFLGGLGMVVVGAWRYNSEAGLIVLGFALLTIATLSFKASYRGDKR